MGPGTGRPMHIYTSFLLEGGRPVSGPTDKQVASGGWHGAQRGWREVKGVGGRQRTGGPVGSLAQGGCWRQDVALGPDRNLWSSFSGTALNSPIWAAVHFLGEGE